MSDGLTRKYFVLKPRGDDAYAAASRTAMRAYARGIGKVNRELASDLLGWADQENAEMYARSVAAGGDREP